MCEAWWAWAEEGVSAAARAAIERLEAEIVPVDLPHIDLAIPVGTATFTVEGAVSVESHLAARAPMSASVRLMLDLARGIPATTFVKAQRARALVARDFERALSDVDVLVTPTTARTAPLYRSDAFASGEVDEAMMYAMVGFTFPLNLTGLPAVQVPCGVDGGGLPVGLQVIGRHGEDELALAVAREVERRGDRPRPRVWHDLLSA